MSVLGIAHRGQKRKSDALELELQACASHLTWMLENELGSSRRAVHALNYGVTIPGSIDHCLLGYSTPRKGMLVGASWEIPNSRSL